MVIDEKGQTEKHYVRKHSEYSATYDRIDTLSVVKIA